MNVSPEGDTGTIVGLPHHREDVLKLLFLLRIIGLVDVQLSDVHRHLQAGLKRVHRVLQVGGGDICDVVRLTAIGIDGSTGIAKGPDEIQIVIRVPLEGVVVVVNQNGIRPTLISHLEGLDEPVIARLALAAKRFLNHWIALLMHSNGFVHHIDHRKRGIFLLHGIIPLHDGCIAVLNGQVGEPTRILGTPNQRMELVSEVVLLGIVESLVAAPVVATTGSFHRSPLRLVLAGNLVPKLVIRGYTAASINVIPCCDVAKELVGVRRQLCLSQHGHQCSQQNCNDLSLHVLLLLFCF